MPITIHLSSSTLPVPLVQLDSALAQSKRISETRRFLRYLVIGAISTMAAGFRELTAASQAEFTKMVKKIDSAEGYDFLHTVLVAFCLDQRVKLVYSNGDQQAHHRLILENKELQKLKLRCAVFFVGSSVTETGSLQLVLPLVHPHLLLPNATIQPELYCSLVGSSNHLIPLNPLTRLPENKTKELQVARAVFREAAQVALYRVLTSPEYNTFWGPQLPQSDASLVEGDSVVDKLQEQLVKRVYDKLLAAYSALEKPLGHDFLHTMIALACCGQPFFLSFPIFLNRCSVQPIILTDELLQAIEPLKPYFLRYYEVVEGELRCVMTQQLPDRPNVENHAPVLRTIDASTQEEPVEANAERFNRRP